MLKSTNPVPVAVQTNSVSLRLVSVVWDGPPITGATVVSAARFRSKSASGSAGFRVNVSKVEAGRAIGSIAMTVTPGAVGVFVDVPWCQIMDLQPGDVLELSASTAGTDTWELDPRGFVVDVR